MTADGHRRPMVEGRQGRHLAAGLVLGTAVLAAALAVRLLYLQLVPVITDEAFEVLAALGMLHGPFIWFGPFDPTTGPLVTWILALAMRLFGPGPYLARAVTLAMGLVTVALAGVLGRSLAAATGRPLARPGATSAASTAGAGPAAPSRDRRLVAALVAALLLAFNPVHVLVNSRVAWSNSATPLFVAAALLVLHAAGRRRDGRLLVLGGFLTGLALQTHLAVLVVLPGLLAWFLARRDLLAWLRRPWPYLAAAAALVGYGNMIVYNVVSRGGALANVQLHTYAWEANPSLATYLQNVAALVRNAAATLAGQVPRVDDPLGWLAGGLLVAWLLAALAYSLARGETMPPLVVLSTALVMPYFNKRYDGLLSQRYTAFLLPICFAAMGVLAADALLWLRGRVQSRTGAVPATFRRAAPIALVVLIIALAAYPVRNTLAYFAAETRAGRDNQVTLDLVRYLCDNLPDGTALYVSDGLKDKEAGGGYRFVRAISYYLSMEGIEHRVNNVPAIAKFLAASPDEPAWVVLTQKDYDELTAGGVRLAPVAGGPALPNTVFVAEVDTGNRP